MMADNTPEIERIAAGLSERLSRSSGILFSGLVCVLGLLLFKYSSETFALLFVSYFALHIGDKIDDLRQYLKDQADD